MTFRAIPGYPPLPSGPAKTLLERLEEAKLMRGQVSDGELSRILKVIYGSARDFGESSLDIPCEKITEITSGRHAQTIEKIQTIVAKHFNVTRAEIVSKHRYKSFRRPRMIAMYLSRVMTPCSFGDIAWLFGRRDHSTVIHCVRKIDKLVETDPVLANEITVLKGMLR